MIVYAYKFMGVIMSLIRKYMERKEPFIQKMENKSTEELKQIFLSLSTGHTNYSSLQLLGLLLSALLWIVIDQVLLIHVDTLLALSPLFLTLVGGVIEPVIRFKRTHIVKNLLIDRGENLENINDYKMTKAEKKEKRQKDFKEKADNTSKYLLGLMLAKNEKTLKFLKNFSTIFNVVPILALIPILIEVLVGSATIAIIATIADVLVYTGLAVPMLLGVESLEEKRKLMQASLFEREIMSSEGVNPVSLTHDNVDLDLAKEHIIAPNIIEFEHEPFCSWSDQYNIGTLSEPISNVKRLKRFK